MWPKLSVGVESSVRQNLNSECQANHQRERLKGKHGQGAGRGDAFWGNPLLKAPMSSSLLKHSLPSWFDGVSCLKASCRILGSKRTSLEKLKESGKEKKTKPKFSLNSGVMTAVFGSVCIVSLFQGDPLALWAVLCLCWGTADSFVWMGNCTLSFKG